MDVINTENDIKILIVDDNPKNLQVLGGVLRSNNYEIEFSTSGEGAIKWINEENFDLVLLDVMMPSMDGFEACTKIRKVKSANDLPIIFLTAKTEPESILKGFQVGGQDYVGKPFNSDELLARVKTQVELNQARQKLKNVNVLLEKKVAERTVQLELANKELEALDAVKVEFLTILSHELRTPLNGIKGSLQLLKVRIENEDLIKLLNILDTSVSRLESFSYTALLITKLKSEKHRFEIQPINLKAELDFCLLPLNDKLLEKEIKIDNQLSNDIIINTDTELFHELFQRILENSIKYTTAKSTVTISAKEIKDSIQINVLDEGEGFPEKILDNKVKLFNPGEEFVNTNLGLNLYLSTMIMTSLGGSLEIKNMSDGGALVSLSFLKNVPVTINKKRT